MKKIFWIMFLMYLALAVFLVSCFGSAFLLWFGCDYQTADAFQFITFWISVIICSVSMVLNWTVTDKEARAYEKNFHADKYTISIDSSELFQTALRKTLKCDGYDIVGTVEDETKKLSVYTKNGKISTLQMTVVAEVDELTNEILELLDVHVTRCLESYYCQKEADIAGHINGIMLVCANRLTHAFTNLINTPIIQERGKCRFLAGISYGGKKLYVAKNGSFGGNGIYKKMSEQFFKLFSFLNPVKCEKRPYEKAKTDNKKC